MGNDIISGVKLDLVQVKTADFEKIEKCEIILERNQGKGSAKTNNTSKNQCDIIWQE